jgi:exopolysaccharide production protein ExoZ
MTGTLALEDYCQSGAFRFPRFLGDASYSIYLSHLMAMAVSSRLVPRSFQAAHVIPTLLFEVAFAVAAGCAVYVVVEKRLTEMTRKLTTGWARPAKVAQGH